MLVVATLNLVANNPGPHFLFFSLFSIQIYCLVFLKDFFTFILYVFFFRFLMSWNWLFFALFQKDLLAKSDIKVFIKKRNKKYPDH